MGNNCACNNDRHSVEFDAKSSNNKKNKKNSDDPNESPIPYYPPRRSSISEYYQNSIYDPARKYLKDFEIQKKIGQGSFGSVFLVKSKTQKKLFAMKQITKTVDMVDRKAQQFLSERCILSQNDHPLLLKLFYSFQDSNYLYLITEYAECLDLKTQLRYKWLKDSEIVFYCSEIIVALEFLHKRNIIYRDLKPENILITREGHIKLADFGLSKILSDPENQRSSSACGTFGYIAPEILSAQEDGYDTQVDLWSFGTTLYELYHGQPAYFSNDKKVMIERAMNKDLVMSPKINPKAQDLILALLEPEPSKRMTMQQLKEHAMFSNVNWEKVKSLEEIPPKPISKESVEKELQKFSQEFQKSANNNNNQSKGSPMNFKNTAGISIRASEKNQKHRNIEHSQTTDIQATQAQTQANSEQRLSQIQNAPHIERYSYNYMQAFNLFDSEIS